MALIKRKTRKKLVKQLSKLVKRHGAEIALALVSGMVGNLATDASEKQARKQRAKTPARTVVIRKRPPAAARDDEDR